jgi:hypothetical protein
VRVTVIGRPQKVVDAKSCVITVFQSKELTASLPKELPTPTRPHQLRRLRSMIKRRISVTILSQTTSNQREEVRTMKLWMDVMRDIEHVIDDYERFFDAWEAGGVNGLVIGPMFFNTAKLLPGTRLEAGKHPIATFDPNPVIYRRLGVSVPPSPESLVDKRKRLEKMLQAAKDRGWSVWIFQASAGASLEASSNPITDDRTQQALCARMIDTLQHYPMADGAIMDGPEWGYEIAPHHMNHRSYMFHDLPESAAPKCKEMGYNYDDLVAAKDRLFATLHSLKSSNVLLHASGGLLGAFRLLHSDPDLVAWLRFRVESLTGFFRNVRTCLDSEMNQPVRLGVGPRAAAFAPLCGYDFALLAEFIDVLLPKFYFFHRGFDGMIGTVYRYVETLTDWNPGLSDTDALAVVAAIFGLVLPGVHCREDFESALSREFLQQIVHVETVRALAVVDDPTRIVPWVDSGRSPHDGDPMPASDLRLLLQSAQTAGLQRFLYHHHGNLTASEWSVMSSLCGETWQPLKSSYRPPDMLVL